MTIFQILAIMDWKIQRTNKTGDKPCNCLPACFEILYTAEISTAPILQDVTFQGKETPSKK